MVALHGTLHHCGVLVRPAFPGPVFPLVLTLHLYRIAILHRRVAHLRF